MRLSQDKKKQLINRLVCILKDFNCSLAVIFGSFLERDDFRDIDLMIAPKDKRSYSNSELFFIRQKLEDAFGLPFDVIDIHVQNIPLMAEIAQKGLPIILDDEDLWDDFRFKAWIDDMDFRPLLEKFYEERFNIK